MNTKIFAGLLLLASLFAATAASAQEKKSREDLLKEISTLTNSQKDEDRAKGFELCKQFLARYGKDKDDKMVPKVKAFTEKYRETTFLKEVDADKYPEAFALGREILADQPNNVYVMLNLAYAGYNANNKKQIRTYDDETAATAAKAMQLIDAGTVPTTYEPFKDKDEASAFMYFIQGKVVFEKDMKAAAHNIYKAGQFNSNLKGSTAVYMLIAYYYEDVYQKAANELKAKMNDKAASEADKKALTDRIDKVVDAMLDSYARLYKAGVTENSPEKDNWKQRLTQIYKFRKSTEDGLTEFINYVVTTPMPDPATI